MKMNKAHWWFTMANIGAVLALVWLSHSLFVGAPSPSVVSFD
jgi:hypothetical protein